MRVALYRSMCIMCRNIRICLIEYFDLRKQTCLIRIRVYLFSRNAGVISDLHTHYVFTQGVAQWDI